MRNDQCWFLDILNDVGHCKRFPAAGNPQKCLCFITTANTVTEFFNCLGLITGGLEIRMKFELCHFGRIYVDKEIETRAMIPEY